jgi:hypothetical protein
MANGNVKDNSTLWGAFGMTKEVFMSLVKWGAIGGLILGTINFLAVMLSTLFSWGSLFGIVGSAFNFLSLIPELLQGAVYGILATIVVVKFSNSFPFSKFKTLFWKLFGVMLILDVVLMVLFGGFFLIFSGPLTFLFTFGGSIVADFVFAKFVSGKIGSLVKI